MKLRIKNYDKVLGWNWDSDLFGPDWRWVIRGVYENTDDYTFYLTLEDSNNNIKKTELISISRIGVKEYDDFKYQFLPHRNNQVTKNWFSNLSNVKLTFESEMRRKGYELKT